MKPFLLPAFLTLFACGIWIAGGYNIDHWTFPRAVVFTGVLIALVISLRDRERDD